jgi:hypothetical protein
MTPDDLEPGADEVRGTDAERVAEGWVADWDRRLKVWRDRLEQAAEQMLASPPLAWEPRT